MQIDPNMLHDLKAEIAATHKGGKSQAIRRWAELLGCSERSIRRAIAAPDKSKNIIPERRNQDYDAWTDIVFQVKKRPPESAGEVSTEQALRFAVKNGILPPAALEVPVGTYNRIAREKGLNKTTKHTVRFQAEKPNAAHHFDASSSKFLYVAKKVKGEPILKLQKPHKDYKNKPVPCDRLRPWVYGVADDHSGLLVVRYTVAQGENMSDSLSFLQYAWSKIGIPDQLLADQGVLKKGLASQDFFNRIDVEFPEMNPFSKEAHGKIERPWRTLWHSFEKQFYMVDDWQKFEISLTELNRQLENYLEEYNQLPHRWERDITREQAWKRVNLNSGIVKIPENALSTVVKRKKRKVATDGILQHDNHFYEVKGLYDAWVYVFEGLFEDKIVVQDIRTGIKYDVKDFEPLTLGEFKARPETPHQKAVKEAASLSGTQSLYTEIPEENEKVLSIPLRETEMKLEDPLNVRVYHNIEEAMKAFMEILGVSLEPDHRAFVKETILENGLNKQSVKDLALEFSAAVEKVKHG